MTQERPLAGKRARRAIADSVRHPVLCAIAHRVMAEWRVHSLREVEIKEASDVFDTKPPRARESDTISAALLLNAAACDTSDAPAPGILDAVGTVNGVLVVRCSWD